MIFKKTVMATSMSALAIAISSTAIAQDSGGVLDEIIVTSQKTSQNLQEVPIAVSVLPAEVIDNKFSSSIENLQVLVPSISFRKGSTSANSAISIAVLVRFRFHLQRSLLSQPLLTGSYWDVQDKPLQIYLI